MTPSFMVKFLILVLLLSSSVFASDPCTAPIIVDEPFRLVSSLVGSSPRCDKGAFNPDLWYTFRAEGESAVIPTSCVKNNRCSTQIGLRVNLEGQSLPAAEGDIISAALCGAYSVLDKYDCCVLRTPVEIVRCGNDMLAYRFREPFDRCSVSVCTVERDNVVPVDAAAQHGEPQSGSAHVTEGPEPNQPYDIQEDEPFIGRSKDGDTDSNQNSPLLSATTTAKSDTGEGEQGDKDLVITGRTTPSNDSGPAGMSSATTTPAADPALSSTNMTETAGVTFQSEPPSPVTPASDSSGATTAPPVSNEETSADAYSTLDTPVTFGNPTTAFPADFTTNLDATRPSGSVADPVTSTASPVSETTLSVTSGETKTEANGTQATVLTTSSLDTLVTPASPAVDDTMTDAVSQAETPSTPTYSPTTDATVPEASADTVHPTVISQQLNNETLTSTAESFFEVDPTTSSSSTLVSAVLTSSSIVRTTPVPSPVTTTPPSSAAPPLTVTATTTTTTIDAVTAQPNTTSSTPAETQASTSATPPRQSSPKTTEMQPPPSIPSSPSSPSSSSASSSSPSPTLSLSPAFSDEEAPQATPADASLSPSVQQTGTPTQGHAPPTPTDSPHNKKKDDYGSSDDLIMVEKVRLVFEGDYGNDTLFAIEVQETLNRFLMGTTRLQKSKDGDDWWFELTALIQPKTYRNQSTFMDFRVRHTYGKEIIEAFESFQLRKYFREQSNLTLLVECRTSRHCERSAHLDSSSEASGASWWGEHGAVLITVLALVGAFLLVLLVGLMAGRCRDKCWRKGSYNASRDDYAGNKETKPLNSTKLHHVAIGPGLSSPFTDSQITQNESPQPSSGNQHHQPGMETTSFTGNASDKDGGATGDDNTWVIPLDDALDLQGNGHSAPPSDPSSNPTNTKPTTTIQGRDDAFVSTKF